MEENEFGNILTEFDIDNLFGGDDGESSNDVYQEKENDASQKQNDKKETTSTDVNPDELFGGLQESVGDDEESENDIQVRENTDSKKGISSSPNFHSSVLSALRDDGILPELSDEDIELCTDDEAFKDAIEKVVTSRVNLRNQRIEKALNAGADIEEIKQYENILTTLSNVTDEALEDEGRKGEDLRRRIIAQDYLNRGFSKEKIERELKKTFDAGTDIEDAKEALEANLQFYQQKYQDIIDTGKELERMYKENTKKQGELLRSSIVEDNKGIFSEIGVDKKMRQKIYDNISKPAYKDAEGNWYTEIQNYEMNNRTDFLKYVSLFFTMTDGFKNIDKVIQKSVLKERKSSIKELENKLKGTSRNSTGKLSYIGQADPESEYLGNFTLDI